MSRPGAANRHESRATPCAPRVVFADNVVAEVFRGCLLQYMFGWSGGADEDRYLPQFWGYLGGQVIDNEPRITHFRRGVTARGREDDVDEEFAQTIVPQFGASYMHSRRGFWSSSTDLYSAYLEFEAVGASLLGSIHMHADLDRFWPDQAAGLRLSERPTDMDTFMFTRSGWPVNCIFHIEHGPDIREIEFAIGCIYVSELEAPPVPAEVAHGGMSCVRAYARDGGV